MGTLGPGFCPFDFFLDKGRLLVVIMHNGMPGIANDLNRNFGPM